MNRFPRSDRRLRAATCVVALAALAGACVKQDAPTVAISKIEASLVFGVTIPEKQPVTPPQIALAQPAAEFQAVERTDVPDDPFANFSFPTPAPLPGIDSPTVAIVDDCPEAPPTAVAERSPEINISNPPPVGSFRFKHGGFFHVNGEQRSFTGFERRLVRNFIQVNDTTFTFQTVQPSLAERDRFVQTTFKVNTAATQRDVSPGGSTVITGPRVGDPERGVTLVKQEIVDANGIPKGDPFQPTTGVLLLPLPVQSGESYQSVAVDPKTGQTLVHDAQVLRRQRVDACGQVIDGWLVSSTERSSTSPTGVTYNYIIAPQYGGIIISEQTIASDGGDTAPLDLTTSIGQLVPDPLPDGA